MTGDGRYDVIVVGAGIAGSLVAGRLSRSGRRVLVLEAGVRHSDAERGHREVLDAYFTASPKVPSAPYRPSDTAPWPEVTHLSGTEDGGYRADGYFVQRGELPYASGYVRVNGGSGVVWTGLTPRMLPEDFDTEQFGYGRRWPLTYADLEPCYRAAERELGVCADAEEQRTHVGLPIRDGYVFPMRALPPSHLDQVMAARLDGRRVTDPVAGQMVELRVVGTPHARNSTPDPAYDDGAGYTPVGAHGRPDPHSRCVGNATCIPHCPAQAKYTPLKTQGQWGPSVTLVDRAVVSRVLIDAAGRAKGVEYRSYDGSRHTTTADVVVLSAHAIENAKLLLMSELANRSDQVGRNLMDHPVLLTWGLMPEPVGPYRGPGSTSGFEGFRGGPGRARRAPFRIEIGNWGWVWAKGQVDGDVSELLRQGLFGPALRRAVGNRVARQFALQFEMEQAPDPANRITIDPSIRDPLGLPRPIVTYGLSDHVKEGIAAAKGVSDEIFSLLGAEDHTAYAPEAAWPGRFEHRGESYGYRGAGHGAGTHIMGSSAGTSVVDSWQRCWDHPGLYAVGCGSMPSVATSNPTLTMAALALRSAERIEADLAERDRPADLTRTPGAVR
ncbi:glucose-methanol-choline oxidoreductase [Streptomyces yokosukanensis]|uniref:Glucose-methanol-choline oxidoreductase n=1 Tax=Streptomyces yokosukanensis TaxID=67386 RepID=A0A101NQA3_9ACTN|nr:GMC family oxidoreductase [Streptomyces yokosukanensis]KUM97197.1 glucose-methanol-choline oxidoreductase [Streptomyces yokosukanensis]